MDVKTGAYLRERRQLTGPWSATPRVVAGLIGASIGALTPGNPTALQFTTFTILKAIGGAVIVETTIFLYRFVWTTPKAMHFNALRLVAQADERAKKDVAAVNERWETKIKTYKQNTQNLQQANAELTAQLQFKRKNQAFANALTEQYNIGLHDIMNWSVLRKDKDFNDEDMREWLEKEKAWTAGVRGMLEQEGRSPQVIAHFWNIHVVQFVQFHHFHHVHVHHPVDTAQGIINEYADVKILS